MGDNVTIHTKCDRCGNDLLRGQIMSRFNTQIIVWQDNIPNTKYIVFMCRTNTYTGELKSSTEGRMEWMTLDEMRQGGLDQHMEECIRVMLEDDVPRAYGISGSGVLKAVENGCFS